MPPADTEFLSSAPLVDLDVAADEGLRAWQERLRELARARLAVARSRLTGLGVIDIDGELRSDERPSDMAPDSETSVETG